jgi:hypothetical protein
LQAKLDKKKSGPKQNDLSTVGMEIQPDDRETPDQESWTENLGRFARVRCNVATLLAIFPYLTK